MDISQILSTSPIIKKNDAAPAGRKTEIDLKNIYVINVRVIGSTLMLEIILIYYGV